MVFMALAPDRRWQRICNNVLQFIVLFIF
jgi:hypothetical protein